LASRGGQGSFVPIIPCVCITDEKPSYRARVDARQENQVLGRGMLLAVCPVSLRSDQPVKVRRTPQNIRQALLWRESMSNAA
jgi:hypothetical protein